MEGHVQAGIEPPAGVDTAALLAYGLELGLDVVGTSVASAYVETEAAIRERSARGLFADLKFTMARPEVSCHPELLVDGAATVVSAALSYWRPDGEAPTPSGHPRGRIARYTRDDAYESLRERLEEVARWLAGHGHAARVLVDSNHHVDRAAAERGGVGFIAKNTNVITRSFGSWVVLGTLVTDAALEPTEPVRAGCGSCTACIDACPTDAIIDGGGVLDVTRCITYWTQSRHPIPLDVRESMGDMVYGCDICQDVCPWNRATQGRRADVEPALGTIDLVDWLEAPDRELNERYARFFIPRRQVKFLRRNALVALGNSGREENAALAAPFLVHPDALLREHAEWALRRLGGSIAHAALAAADAGEPSGAAPPDRVPPAAC